MNTMRALAACTSLACFGTGCATAPSNALERPLYEIDCAEMGGIASRKGEVPFEITFRNARDDGLDLYWVNYEGMEELKKSISPGESWSHITYRTHPWVARDESGRCVAAYLSTSGALVELK